VIDPKTRVAKARVEYNNASGKLKPEMFASGLVEAKLTNKSNSIVVPKQPLCGQANVRLFTLKQIQTRGKFYHA
jgi:hypothetical protein